MSSSSSSSPCAACKFLRRKCTPGCVFAPYFPPDQPAKFVSVHRVFGASNVAKLLNELSPSQREDAVSSLAYEAEARLHDPVYGCVGYIWLLQHKLNQVQRDLYNAKKELSTYLNTSIAEPQHHAHHLHQHRQQLQGAPPFAASPTTATAMSLGLAAAAGASSHQQILMRELQLQMAAVQQIAATAVAANREQDMRRSYEQQQQEELARLSSALLEGGRGYQQIAGGTTMAATTGPPSGLTLLPSRPIEGLFSVQKHQMQQMWRSKHNERSGVGPSSSGKISQR